MEGETILCSSQASESLIMAEKQHEKDSHVAQIIHDECDKKFNAASDVGDGSENEHDYGNHNDVEDVKEEASQLQNGAASEKDNASEECTDAKATNETQEAIVELDSLNEEHAGQEVSQHNEEETESTYEQQAVVPDEVLYPNQQETAAHNLAAPASPTEISNGHKEEGDDDEDAHNDNDITNGNQVTNNNTAPIIVDEIKQSEEKLMQKSIPEPAKQSSRVIEDVVIKSDSKENALNGPRKGAIATSMDLESVRDAYNDIRADNSETQWAVFKYEATRIVCSKKGITFEEFKEQFNDDERAYGYIRLQTGDEMSKRHKFLFVTWIGPGVSVLKRAKMSIDKAIIKNVVSNFAVELQLETLTEFDLPFFIESLNKASGANYGTGVRDI